MAAGLPILLEAPTCITRRQTHCCPLLGPPTAVFGGLIAAPAELTKVLAKRIDGIQ